MLCRASQPSPLLLILNFYSSLDRNSAAMTAHCSLFFAHAHRPKRWRQPTCSVVLCRATHPAKPSTHPSSDTSATVTTMPSTTKVGRGGRVSMLARCLFRFLCPSTPTPNPCRVDKLFDTPILDSYGLYSYGLYSYGLHSFVQSLPLSQTTLCPMIHIAS